MEHISFCALASVVDVIVVLFLYFAAALTFRNPLWIQNLKWDRIVLMILIGGTGATLVEVWYVSLGSWAYNKTMPIIPIVNVGASPVLQFMILPLLVYILSLKCLKY